MVSVVVLQWITSDGTRPLVAPVHTHYALPNNSSGQARRSANIDIGQVLRAPEGQLVMQQPRPDSAGEDSECGGARIGRLGILPSILSAEYDASNCENKSSEKKEVDPEQMQNMAEEKNA